jgi:hypothetical protein
MIFQKKCCIVGKIIGGRRVVMKKILALTVFVGICCMSFGVSSSIATNGKDTLFFCTRDIETSGF